MSTWIKLLSLAVLQGFFPATAQTSSVTAETPNVVLILADDLGWGDLGCYGNQRIETPQLDQMAENGVRLTQCYSSAPVCSPTRAALMTGVYQQRLGRHFDWAIGGMGHDSGLPHGTVTMPQMLKENGYATGMTGKWHIGGVESRAPNAFGFEEFKGLRGGNLDYWTHTDNKGRLDLWNNTEKFQGQEGYLTDLIGDWSIDFIEKNRENPFFLYVSFTAPHFPYQGKEPELRNIDRESYSMAGGSPEIYESMVESMDQNIGRIMDALDAAGLKQKTLVIFISDNGGVQDFANNGSFRGHKATLYEAGIRVPGILYWPGQLPAGKVSDQPAITMDFTASILAATRTPLSSKALPMDGMNILPILTGEKPEKDRELYWLAKLPREGSLFWRALRAKDFKLLQVNDSIFLYDLKQDPEEKQNLLPMFPEKVSQLKRQYSNWECSLPPRNPSENAFLASITWPDNELSQVEKFELGWAGDTIPNFSSGFFNYRVELPSTVTSIPALVAKPQDINAKVKVDPAFTFNGSEEDRTTTFTVTAQNDSVEVYTIVFEKKVAEENMQPFYAEPFIARFQHRTAGGLQNYFMEIVNPGNQPLDLSYYMIASNRFADGPDPNSVIQSYTEADSTTWFNRRYAKYIPGRKWPVYSEWNTNPATVEPDPDVTVPRSMLPGGESFLLGQLGDDRHRDPEDPVWPIVHKLDVQFINTEGEYGTYTNNWNEPVHRVGTPLVGQKWGSARFMYKILNDSVRDGLKPATDPNDFELIECLSMADYTSRWVVAGHTMGALDVQWRKPEYIFPNPIAQASFGTNAEDSEWIVEDRGYNDQAQNEAELGNHFFNPPTMYMSTVTAYLYKVSPGYSDAETIDGITTGTTVATFLSNIYKADEGQTLTVKSYANPGDTLLSDEVISPSDTLVVVSKDGENTTKYILSVTEEELSADAKLSSTEYTVTEDAAAGTGVVAGMAYGTTLEEVVSNVSKHEGAMLRIVDENGLDIPYKRLNYMNAYVASTANSETYFEVTAENYTDKILYQLQPSVGEDDAFIISDVYGVSEETKIIRYVPLGTTLETFQSNIIVSPGASYVILDKAGYEKTSGNLAQDDRIIVTSSDETVQTIYYLSLIIDSELNQSTPSLAFITSNVYTIDQVTAVIDSVVEETTVADFLSNIVPATDAEVVIRDANGDVKIEGALAQDDMVEVTSALGDLSVEYKFGSFKEKKDTGAETYQANQIKVYPNPTNAHLYIEGLQSGSRIKVYNITGKLIRDVISSDQRKMISLEGEPASLYLIVVSNKHVPHTHFKVIKE